MPHNPLHRLKARLAAWLQDQPAVPTPSAAPQAHTLCGHMLLSAVHLPPKADALRTALGESAQISIYTSAFDGSQTLNVHAPGLELKAYPNGATSYLISAELDADEASARAMAQRLHAALHASGLNAALELYGTDDEWLMDLDAAKAEPASDEVESEEVRAQSSALAVSKRRFERGECGRLRQPMARARMPMGTLTAKSQGQLATARMALATVGPMAEETATTRALTPMPRPSWLCG